MLADEPAHLDLVLNMLEMTRSVAFAAACSPDGPCGAAGEATRLTGHNYVLDVTVAGRINPATGVILNIKEVDRVVRSALVGGLQDRLLDCALPREHGLPATAERVLMLAHVALADKFAPAAEVSRLTLRVTPLESVSWRADHMPDNDCGLLLTRAYEFSASHRLHSPHLSETENREMFGKCNYLHGHGHNYVLEVSVIGPVNERTGRIIDPAALDAVVNAEVVERYDHRHFNYELPEFQGLVPSSEVITTVIWGRLRDRIPAPARLARIVLRETARNVFEYRGED